jgi:hypothetical protein
MSLRYEILKACAANPGAPMTELCDAIEHDRQKTTWSVRDCAKAGLLSMRRDDVTGQPGYTLTAEGKQRLAEGPGSKQGSNMKKAGSDSEGGETDVKAQSAEIPPQIPPPQYDPNSAAFSASTDAEQDQQRAHLHLIGVLADIRAAVGDPEGKLMQDELVERVRAVYDLGEAHKRACLKWETAMMAAVGEDGINDVVGKIADLQHKVSMQDAELFKQAGVVVDLRNQVESLQREAMRGASLLSGIDRYTAAGYLVRASKRKPRTLLDRDKARDAALSSIRAGAQRAEVFALVPIGQARRGVEWRSA